MRLSALCLRHARVPAIPTTWKAEKIPGGYVVRDTNGQALAYV
jgi:hypothetical protein